MNILEHLGIQTVQLDAKTTILEMPVADTVKQPFGILHGGVNSVLAETAASLAANEFLRTQQTQQVAVGVNIQTNHLRAVTGGVLQAKSSPVRLGRQLLVYQVTTFQKGSQVATSLSTVTLTVKTVSKYSDKS
ncbi:PaaI family thioesterase [Agrilactobacillus fermenti]|uniref:PaaI family thioesterase n=1 Tax=Agrilactobacillus fermenti TaxID=2586909 RepID=UPI001E2EBBC6|nr:hotdog fold thioesterase [Agrilactobacillus fermenti]MCD2256997.1 hotdog fold thioesterase [Agrilactobacillus fermenti]